MELVFGECSLVWFFACFFRLIKSACFIEIFIIQKWPSRLVFPACNTNTTAPKCSACPVHFTDISPILRTALPRSGFPGGKGLFFVILFLFLFQLGHKRILKDSGPSLATLLIHPAGVLPIAVSVWHLASLQQHLVGFHGAHDLQVPCKVQGASLDFLTSFPWFYYSLLYPCCPPCDVWLTSVCFQLQARFFWPTWNTGVCGWRWRISQWLPASPGCCLKKSLGSHDQENSTGSTPVLAAQIGGSLGGYTLGEGSSIWDSHTAASVVGVGEVKGPHWGTVLGMGSSSPGNIEHWYALWMGC